MNTKPKRDFTHVHTLRRWWFGRVERYEGRQSRCPLCNPAKQRGPATPGDPERIVVDVSGVPLESEKIGGGE